MGGWVFVEPYLEWVLGQVGAKANARALCRAAGLGVDRGRARCRCTWRSSSISGRGAWANSCSVTPGLVPGITSDGAAIEDVGSRDEPGHDEHASGCHDRNSRADARRIGDRGDDRQWFKKPGDAVKVDEPLVELETDKVTIEVPAPAAGVLGEIAAKDGETVAVGAVLGQIEDGAGAAQAAAASAVRRQRGPPPPANPLPHRGCRRRRCRRSRRRYEDRRRSAARCVRGAGHRQGRPRHQGRRAGRDRARRRGRRRRCRRPPPRCRCARRRRPTMPRARSACG